MPRPLALITGASSGIGLEIARLLAQDHDVILTGRNMQALKELGAEVRGLGAAVTLLITDLGKPGAARALAAEIKKLHMDVDVLVNNAGLGVVGELWKNDPDQLAEMLQVNMIAAVDLTRALLPGMIDRRRGRILNVASTAAFQPGPGMAGYYATKAFLLSFSEALSAECAGTGVTVSCLCPGPVQTAFAERSGVGSSNLFKSGLMAIMDAEAVARSGVMGMKQGKRVIIPGALNQLAAWSAPMTPRPILLALVKYLSTPKE